MLGVTLSAINLAGDIVNLARGEGVKGALGVVIAGLLLIYLIRPGVRACVVRIVFNTPLKSAVVFFAGGAPAPHNSVRC